MGVVGEREEEVPCKGPFLLLMALGPRGATSAELVALLLFSTLSAYIPEFVLMGASLILTSGGLAGLDTEPASIAFFAT